MSEFLRKPDLIPTQGVDYSIPPDVVTSGVSFPKNMHYIQGDLRKRDGKSKIGTTLIGGHRCMHLGRFRLSTGDEFLIALSRYNVHQYSAVSNIFTDITGADLTGDETNFFDDAVIPESDLFLFSNGIGEVRKWPGSGNSADLGSGLIGKTIEYFSPYFVIGNVTEGGNPLPTKVKWSDSNQPSVFTGGNSGARVLSDEPSHLRRLKKLRNYLFAYKDQSCYRGSIVSTSEVIRWGNPFSIGKGIYAPRAVADIGDAHIYMGNNDFHFNNGVRIEDIGGKVREHIFNRLNRDKANTCHAIHIDEYKEVWFFITVSGNDWPTEVWKYRYDLGFWYQDTVDECVTAVNFKETQTLTWDEVEGNWNDQDWTWDEALSSAESPLQYFGFGSGLVQKRNIFKKSDNNVAVSGEFETGDYAVTIQKTGIEREQRYVQLDVWASGSAGSLYISTDYGKNWSFIKTKEFDGVVKKRSYFFDIEAPRMRFRILNADKTGTLKVRRVQPYYMDAGEILE